MNLTTITLNIIKKNRVYFACKNQSGYDVKLRITEASKDLSLGEHELLVEDASVRTKYGTDVIYVLHSEVNQNSKIVLKSEFNHHLVERCKKLGGKWDSEDKVWVFTDAVKEEVEELDFIFNSEPVTVKITALEEVYDTCRPLTFLGLNLAKACSKNSGAVICEGVSLISGRVRSGGSNQYWQTIMDEGSVVKLKVPRELLNEFKNDYFKVEVL